MAGAARARRRQAVKRLAIATRSSRLALWQAEHVKQRLAALYSGLRIELLPMTTRGDELIDQRLDQAGGKGLFVKELENALADGRAEIAVHSMKDVPADLPAGFELAAILAREDARDAFVSNRYASLEGMPAAARVGTSSLRRSARGCACARSSPRAMAGASRARRPRGTIPKYWARSSPENCADAAPTKFLPSLHESPGARHLDHPPARAGSGACKPRRSRGRTRDPVSGDRNPGGPAAQAG